MNNLGTHGRWAFAEFRDVWTIKSEFDEKIEGWVDALIERAVADVGEGERA